MEQEAHSLIRNSLDKGPLIIDVYVGGHIHIIHNMFVCTYIHIYIYMYR